MKRKIVGLLLSYVLVQGVYASEIDIRGRVLLVQNGEAIEMANVVLQTKDSVYVKGTVTSLEGDFTFSNIETGDYRIIVSSMGYKTQYIDINGFDRDLQLNEILMEEDMVMLESVTVTASATTSRSDKKVIFPTENQIKASTNGIDLLQQLMLPKIQVNQLFGEVKLPGEGEV